MPPGAGGPDSDIPDPQDRDDSCEQSGGSTLECQNQILKEQVRITGTPFSLHYSTGRAPGHIASATLTIPLSGASVPPPLDRIDLEILIAGRRITQSFSAAPNQTTTFTWDGKDGYGRRLLEKQPVTVRIGYHYPAVYLSAPVQQTTFGLLASGFAITGTDGKPQEGLTVWQEHHTTLKASGAPHRQVGGWTLSVHHLYDPIGQVLDLGDGRRRHATGDILSAVIASAVTFSQNSIEGLALTPDGSLYAADFVNHAILRVAPDGSITTVADRAQVNAPLGLAPGPGGSEEVTTFDAETGKTRTVQQPRPILYIADTGNQRIVALVRLEDGRFFTIHVAGSGTRGFNGDNIPATFANLNTPQAITLGGDGSLFIADSGNHRVRQVRPDGIITTVAGTGVAGFSGDGGLATQARLNFPIGLAFGPDGSLYIADELNHRIRRVGPDGIITTVAGTGIAGYSGDGGDATLARLSHPLDVVATADGGLFVTDSGNQRVRLVQPGGIITTVAGTGISGFSGDGGPATRAQLATPVELALSPDGTLYFTDNVRRIRRLLPPLPGRTAATTLIAAEDGSQVYEFGPSGKHLQTLHALTGATLYSFTYDAAGRLASVTDGDGNVTTIERDGSGNPTAIVAPFGQRTTLSLDTNGYLASVTNPAGEPVQLAYTADGLLTSFTDPRSNTSRMTYDALGRFIRDEDAAGGSWTLARTDSANGFFVTKTSALGRTTTYQLEYFATGGDRAVNTFPDGTQTRVQIGTDGSRALTFADGMTFSVVAGPDPRFGMQAPVANSLTATTPGGLTHAATASRAVTLTDPTNPLSLQTQTASLISNGRTYTSTYEAASRTFTTTMPGGRQFVVTLDAQGRTVQKQAVDLAPTTRAYDSRGRLSSVTLGTGSEARTLDIAYNAEGDPVTLTDPLGRPVRRFAYDAAGRVTREILPDDREILYTYDAKGNVTAVTPPGRPAHTFAYTPVDLRASDTPPDVGVGTTQTQYTYDADRQLTRIARPDGQTVDISYDSAGRLSMLTLPNGQKNFTYHATTGRLVSVTAPGGVTLSYSYNGGLPDSKSWDGPVTGSVSRTYDSDTRVTSESVNGGSTITFQYDPDNLPVQSGALSLTRDPQHGLVTGTTLGNVTDTWSYNGFGEVVGYRAAASGTDVYTVQYSRDQLGRITQKIETLGGVTVTYDYTYDLAGRLSEVRRNGALVATYTYDNNSNRLTVTGPSGTVIGTYDAQDRLLQYGGATYTYTANGELLSRTAGSQTTTYGYDVFGNLRDVTLPDGTQIAYIIDGRNRRIGKRVNGTPVQGFLYQNRLNLIAELDGANNVVSRFVYASRIHMPDYMIKGGVTYRIIADHLGSARFVIDVTTGGVVQRLDYDEFGTVTLDTNPGFQPFGFAGGIYDAHTRLSRFGARDYEAATGRWTAKDPRGFVSGPNLYSYVNNDPVNFIDPPGTGPTPPSGPERFLAEISEIIENISPDVRDPAEPRPHGDGPVPEGFDPQHAPTRPDIPQIGPRPLLPQWIPGEEPTDPMIVPPQIPFLILLLCGILVILLLPVGI